jgi:hypothetical protein
MGFMAKLRPGTDAEAAAARTGVSAENLRVSNGLKEFLRHLGKPEHGQMLDLAPVSQATTDFVTGRRFKLYANDILRSWHDFLAAELAALRVSGSSAQGAAGAANRPDPAERAARFVSSFLDYPAETFHGVLAWDLIDYLPREVGQAVVARLHELVRPGGAILAIFHSRPPDRFHRYRVGNGESLECIPAAALVPFARVLPNREILNLFGKFRSSKTFVGRDQIREALFTR